VPHAGLDHAVVDVAVGFALSNLNDIFMVAATL